MKACRSRSRSWLDHGRTTSLSPPLDASRQPWRLLEDDYRDAVIEQDESVVQRREEPAEAPGARIERSPADVLRLVVAVIVIAVLWLIEWLFDDTLVAFVSDLLNGLHAV